MFNFCERKSGIYNEKSGNIRTLIQIIKFFIEFDELYYLLSYYLSRKNMIQILRKCLDCLNLELNRLNCHPWEYEFI